MIGKLARKALARLGKKLGLVIVPEWQAIRLPEERQLRRLFRHLNVDCVFDVGANVGQYAEMLRDEVGYCGHIISFEPNPFALAKLKEKARSDSLWRIEEIALGKSPGQAEFNAVELSDLSSFRAFSSNPHAPRKIESSKINVTVETLAAYLPKARAQYGFKRPYLKLDTQGFDLDVAAGAGGLLPEFVGLQSEIAFQNIYQDAPDYRAALDFYMRSGFVLSRLVANNEIHFPELVEMDAIMINKRFLVSSESH